MLTTGKNEPAATNAAPAADCIASNNSLPAELFSVLTLVKEPCCLLVPDGRILAANPVFLNLLGLPSLKTHQDTFLELVHPEEKIVLQRKLLLLKAKSGLLETNIRLRTSEGTYHQYELQIQLAGKNLALVIKGSTTLTSEVQQFERLAAASLIYDSSFNPIRYNQQFCQMLGYSQQELQQLGFSNLLHPEHAAPFSEHVQQLLREETKGFTIELQLQHKNQHYIWVLYSASPLESTGEEPYITAVALDMSQLKEKEDRLVQEQQDVSLFVDRVTHDMKGPLRSLLALHRIVELEYGHDLKVMEYFNHYHATVERLNTTISDLLTLTQVKKDIPQLRTVNLRNMVQDCLQSLCHLPDFYKISFTIRIEIKENIIIAENLLQTIIQNLLENAIKYCSESAPKVLICIKLKDDQLVLEVSDNGIGISEEAQQHIFDMFYRATTRSTGSGLGLYILKNAVDKLHGALKVRSLPDKGSRFIISLPYQAHVSAKENL